MRRPLSLGIFDAFAACAVSRRESSLPPRSSIGAISAASKASGQIRLSTLDRLARALGVLAPELLTAPRSGKSQRKPRPKGRRKAASKDYVNPNRAPVELFTKKGWSWASASLDRQGRLSTCSMLRGRQAIGEWMIEKISAALATADPTVRKRLKRCIPALTHVRDDWSSNAAAGELTVALARRHNALIFTAPCWPRAWRHHWCGRRARLPVIGGLRAHDH
jgi:hypothetical protein